MLKIILMYLIQSKSSKKFFTINKKSISFVKDKDKANKFYTEQHALNTRNELRNPNNVIIIEI